MYIPNNQVLQDYCIPYQCILFDQQ